MFAPTSVTWTDSYTKELWDVRSGGYSLSQFFTFPSATQYSYLDFLSPGVVPATNAPASLVPSLMLGSFYARVGHSFAWAEVQSDVTLVAFRDITTPVPEPETYAMLVAGLGVMGFVARRRKTVA